MLSSMEVRSSRSEISMKLPNCSTVASSEDTLSLSPVGMTPSVSGVSALGSGS